MNDVFMALWNHVPRDDSTVLMRYLLAILKNLVRNNWKAQKTLKRKMETVPFSEEILSSHPTVDGR